MKILLLISLFILPSLVLPNNLEFTKKELAWIEKHPVIKVSNEDDWPPFDFSQNGEAKGYSIDLIKMLAKKIGIKVKFINGYSWAELLEHFDENNIDMMHVMTKDKQRTQKYLFSKPYMPWRISYFIRNSEKNIHFPKDFSGKKIAAGKGWSTTPLLRKMYPKAEIIGYINSSKIIEAVSTSKVDIGIDNVLAANYTMGEDIVTNVTHGGYINLKEKGKNHFHFVSHKNNPELISIFNKAFEQLSINDKLNLQKKWFVGIEADNQDFTKKENDWIRSNPVVIVGGEMDWAPFDFVADDGRYQGITNDYLNLISKKTGLTFKMVTGLTWSQLVANFKNKKLDLLPAVYFSKDRAKYGNHTHPYYNVRDYIFTKNESSMKSLEDFNNKILAIPKGYITGGKIQKKYPKIQILETRSILDSISAVLNNEADGTFEVQAVMAYVLEKNAIEGIKVISQDMFEAYPLRMLVQKDKQILFSIMNKAIRSIDREEMNTISKKWINIHYDEIIEMQTLIYIGITFLLIIFFFSLHQYFLRKLNKQLHVQKEKLKHLASIDPITKLYNRRFFSEASEHILELSKRNKTDLSIFMLDIDKFKNINDSYGHKVGDLVIIKLASILKEFTRKSDIVCRFGGEEFLILLPETNIEGAVVIAEKIRDVVENLVINIEDDNVLLEHKKLKFTVSIGMSQINNQQDTNIEVSINRADQALYKAKESGRNRLCYN